MFFLILFRGNEKSCNFAVEDSPTRRDDFKLWRPPLKPHYCGFIVISTSIILVLRQSPYLVGEGLSLFARVEAEDSSCVFDRGLLSESDGLLVVGGGVFGASHLYGVASTVPPVWQVATPAGLSSPHSSSTARPTTMRSTPSSWKTRAPWRRTPREQLTTEEIKRRYREAMEKRGMG